MDAVRASASSATNTHGVTPAIDPLLGILQDKRNAVKALLTQFSNTRFSDPIQRLRQYENITHQVNNLCSEARALISQVQNPSTANVIMAEMGADEHEIMDLREVIISCITQDECQEAKMAAMRIVDLCVNIRRQVSLRLPRRDRPFVVRPNVFNGRLREGRNCYTQATELYNSLQHRISQFLNVNDEIVRHIRRTVDDAQGFVYMDPIRRYMANLEREATVTNPSSGAITITTTLPLPFRGIPDHGMRETGEENIVSRAMNILRQSRDSIRSLINRDDLDEDDLDTATQHQRDAIIETEFAALHCSRLEWDAMNIFLQEIQDGVTSLQHRIDPPTTEDTATPPPISSPDPHPTPSHASLQQSSSTTCTTGLDPCPAPTQITATSSAPPPISSSDPLPTPSHAPIQQSSSTTCTTELDPCPASTQITATSSSLPPQPEPSAWDKVIELYSCDNIDCRKVMLYAATIFTGGILFLLIWAFAECTSCLEGT